MKAWALRESDPYDSTYPKRFFEDTVKLLSRDVTWTISIHEGVNEEDKTVDVTLRYGIKPASLTPSALPINGSLRTPRQFLRALRFEISPLHTSAAPALSNLDALIIPSRGK